MSEVSSIYSAVAAPHAHDRASVDKIMLQVCMALVPATAFGLYLFGWPAIILWAITCLSAVAAEAICLWLKGANPWRIKDASALLTGWLVAMTLPPWAPWWIGVSGAAFAIAVGKHVYGGLGQNIFNPAMLTRVAFLISFPVQLTTWVNVAPLGSESAPGLLESLNIIFMGQPLADGMTGATLLGEIKTIYTVDTTVAQYVADSFSLKDSILGFTRGSLGETSALLILLGGLWLLFRGIISWHIPVSMLGTVAVLALLFNVIDPTRYASPLFHLLSGSAMIGAFFIATDYVTSPSSNLGKLIFGAGCGLVMFVIRTWGGFPEAVGFAVLFMNALTPLLDRWCKPRVYGRDLRGNPLNTAKANKVES